MVPAPLAPVCDLKLALYEVANSYCSSSRDLYLRRIDRIKTKPNPAMVRAYGIGFEVWRAQKLSPVDHLSRRACYNTLMLLTRII